MSPSLPLWQPKDQQRDIPPESFHTPACPNYPYCDHAALTVEHHDAVPPYAANVYSTNGQQGAFAHGDGAKYPAGFSRHSCPNYPYCGPTPVHAYAGAYRWCGLTHGVVRPGFSGAQAAPIWGYGVSAAHHGAGAHYPAAIDPHSCPNCPYCQL
ncbi:cuticle protein 1-like [Ischnura elegans]|uniref:cuticle protein 1-like n=1 Tax=Ischnura elegans TaxID=197161 RepID=UPI001ED8ACA6|nr:cuticle protein 1-like [Ischnura elegans]